jgi:hypothetical protein
MRTSVNSWDRRAKDEAGTSDAGKDEGPETPIEAARGPLVIRPSSLIPPYCLITQTLISGFTSAWSRIGTR